ncbi:hypothetical protein GT391_02005 [Pectobacterium brasiliense]|uniref:hypothetical protein n=1 Tax=Pectobacterium brasiliense TaxID=180957 RepID=UPI00057EB9BD|nr:hypothetical protein [Pectobacterium brasiliense]MBN3186094.1 hypothetical protein [Pectobacterium brasiliense]QHG26924.1 hypothetical protein GT391_02005 [Pectobacterium brasiliense]
MVNRYQPAPFQERIIHVNENGDYVKYTDYAELERQRDALQSALNTATESIAQAHHVLREETKRNNELAAENVALKESIPKIGNMVETQYRSKEGNKNRRSTLIERFKRTIDKSDLPGNQKVFLKQNLLNILHEHSNLYECRYLYKREAPATDAALREIEAKAVDKARDDMQRGGNLTFGDCYVSLTNSAQQLREGKV